MDVIASAARAAATAVCASFFCTRFPKPKMSASATATSSTGKLKLYTSPGSCSMSPYFALEGSGLEYEVEKVDIRTRTTETGKSFDEVNPCGGVPVLQLENGELLTEGAAIVQYIADKAPAGTLAPENGTLARYRLQETLSFLSSEIHARFGPLFNPTTPAETRAATIEKLKTKLAKLDARLAAQPFLLGDKWTVADGYLFAMLGWPAYVSLDVSEFKHLATYQERVAAVPHVHRVLVKCGFAKDE